MSSNIIQGSFASGELSPTLFARVDLTKYHTGAATMRNFFVDYRSGASSRPGTKFCNQAGLANSPVRLIPFQSSLLAPYIIEFGDHYVRFFSFGAPVLEPGFAITAASQANPCVITVPGNNFVIGDWISITGVGGMIQLNSRQYFTVLNVAGALVTIGNTPNSTPINSLGFGVYTSGGTAARIYTQASPYAANDLALLKYAQVTNTMYITHPAYAPRTLTFTNPTAWNFATISFVASISAPGGLATAATAGTGGFFSYAVTAVDANGQESLPALVAANNVVNLTTTAGTITVTWGAVAGAVSYNVYRAEVSLAGAVPAGVAYGFQGSATSTSFIDSNIVPDFSQSFPVANNPFAAGNNPGTCCFFQQRLYFGGSNAFPQTFWASIPGTYNNFDFSEPTQADDSIEDTLVSKQVNFIKNMLPMPGGLVIFTAQSAWQLSSGGGLASTSAVTPINATAQTQTYNGSSDLPPIPINWAVLYPQPDGAVIELNYNIYAAIYTGQDISVLSNHLFIGYTLQEWAYAQKPFKLVWAIRNDGVLLSLTYVKEQEMIGWARHDTQGLFKSVATVTEGQYDATYVVAKRFIGGQWLQFVERLDDRISFPYGAEDAWAVDCAIRTTLPTPAANITISASTGTAVVTADAAVFGSTLAGDVIRAGGGIATVTSVISNFAVNVSISQAISGVVPNTTLPAPVVSGQWSLARPTKTFTGLDYLNGQTVSILADGGVIAPQVVVNGSITLSQPATKVIVGLGFTAQIQTMPLDLGNERDTVQGKRKKINACSLRVKDTRGLQFGNDFNTMFPIKEMNPGVLLGTQIPLVTNDEWVVWDPGWNVYAQLCMQLSDPLPATILGVIPEITIGDTPGKP